MQFISIALRVGQQDLTVKPVKIFEHALFYLSSAFCTALLAIVWLVFACKKRRHPWRKAHWVIEMPLPKAAP
ncbi:hypothetical protein [Pseudomonas saudiphocaensis]|uniref:hypothetical protein n=1 Tax=Pseudomonas saudiphocaensis TaxID=1499686 RepID=UPI00187D22D0|nr:hypothetical protein [Pseudomonas saudiphocaensis]MBE7927816.1 hypothetical protein [Pseudomonas saudiphocaensis]